jgi:hypothetical protein
MREFTDDADVIWTVIATDAVVAHGKKGAALAFRRADEPEAEPLVTNITFNSREAADFAIRTLGEKELRRRVALARAALGTPG